jgi:LysM repeat protein
MKLTCPLLMRFSFLWFFFILTAPSPAKSESLQMVKPGDSLSRIAQKFQVSASQLQEVNGLRDEKIYLQRPEEAREELGAGRKKSDGEGLLERAEFTRAQVKGKGFLLDEKDRQLLVRVAKGFLGLKYTPGGSTPNGLDCSAFVQKVFQVFGIDLPRTAREQFQVGYEVAREALRMGDLVFFRRSKTTRPTHVGIYIGDGRFIHTSLRKRRVEIDSLDSRYFAARFIGAKRIEEAQRPLETEESIRNSSLPEE